MTPERWRLIEQLFDAAAALPPEQRAIWLEQACAGDAELLRDLGEMLTVDARGGVISAKIQAAAAEFAREGSSAKRAGPYRLTRELGRGGMGTVYLGERDDGEYDAQVAVKLIRAGMDTEFFLGRFKRERQALARLQHPNIARIFDSGTTAEGLPYIVMELVSGVAITRYAREKNLTVDLILSLYLEVCRAVSYAHQKFVVHRDIKPGNILVQDDGSPKLLDFGICKLMEDRSPGSDTLTGSHLLTPAYASPEQVRGEAVTVSSDIYSLGAVLYELLTGRPPHIIGNPSLAAIVAVCNEPVAAPSSVAKDPAWAGRLAGLLDTVVLKALHKDPERRYETVESFAEDLRRVLNREQALADPSPPVVKRSNRHIWASLLAITVLSIGGIAWYLHPRPTSRVDVETLPTFLEAHRLLKVHQAGETAEGALARSRKAVELFEQAAREHPDSARIQAGLAEAYAGIADHVPGQYAEYTKRAGQVAERGLRLDDRLDDLHHVLGAGGNPVPAVDPDFGYESAKRQIQFIKGMAYTNPEWMEIAFTAAQARKIIDSDKLAIILSVEMDSLSAAQVIKLVEEDGVRQVIPIHLVNNNFGGTAVYSDAFNAVNNFLHSTRNGGNLNNDGFMHVVWDPKMSFRLGRPSYPRPEGFNLVKGGAINIDPVPNDIWAGLRQNYEGGEGGHRNWRGLSDNGQDLIKQLAKKGVLIDVAHMSARSMRDSLDKAQEWNYPMMDSHTGFRAEDGTAESERSLHRAHAKIIGDLGGVIGLGTDWPEGFAPLIHKKDLMMHLGYTALIPGDPNASFWYQHTWDLPSLPGDPEVAHLKLRITTGAHSLTTDLHAIVTIDGKPYTYLLNEFHEGWRGGLVTSPTIELPAHTKSSKVTKITLKVDKGAWWSLRELEVQAVPRGKDPVSTWLSAFKEGLAMMDGKGMAIGTDINGFAPQLWLPADDVQYPIQIAHNIGPARHTPILQKSQVGSRTFSFKQDGIAHYGMLPDFFEALSQQPGSSAALQALFHSVDDVVTMWEKCEKEGKKIK